MSSSIPSAAAREPILASLDALLLAIQAHPNWPPAGSSTPPNPSLFHVWDFVGRSRYILSELDNIREGRPLRHPEQVPGAGAGEQAAAQAYQDVRARATMIDAMVQNPQKLVMLGMSQIDFGEEVRQKSKAVNDAMDKVRV